MESGVSLQRSITAAVILFSSKSRQLFTDDHSECGSTCEPSDINWAQKTNRETHDVGPQVARDLTKRMPVIEEEVNRIGKPPSGQKRYHADPIKLFR